MTHRYGNKGRKFYLIYVVVVLGLMNCVRLDQGSGAGSGSVEGDRASGQVGDLQPIQSEPVAVSTPEPLSQAEPQSQTSQQPQYSQSVPTQPQPQSPPQPEPEPKPEPQPQPQPTTQTLNPPTPINFTHLNQQLQTFNPNFLPLFSQTYTHQRLSQLTEQEAGDYIFLLGKMYIYDILPEFVYDLGGGERLRYETVGRYVLGYFYLRTAAEVYQHPDAYYYLSLLQYMKITPIPLIKTNINKLLKHLKSPNPPPSHLQKLIKQWQQHKYDLQQTIQLLQDVTHDMQTHHLHNIEQNLFLASMLGQTPAKLTMAYLLKDGINTEKNCSAAIGYYLSAMKETKIDIFQFPSDYIDLRNFQKELYARKRLDLKGYGQYDPSVLMGTTMFDEETLHAYQDVAMKYLSGEEGFPVNETISVKMFEKMVDTSKLARVMLGFMYLKGRGVQKNYKRARQLFELQAKSSKVAKQTVLVMKYFDMGYQKQRQQAVFQIKDMYMQYERTMMKLDNVTAAGIRKAADKQKTQPTKTGTDKPDATKQKSAQQTEQQKQKQQQKSASSRNLKLKYQSFRTPMMKYLAGSLVLSDQIKVTDKKYAIYLIDQAAKQGNTLALTQMGLIMLDGSDSSFDCQRAANYFSKQALSLVAFQQRVELAKMGIKNRKYMFSFVKYVQLMMVGYRNAFVNALYLSQVYGNQVFGFDGLSWSVAEAKKNSVYKFLLKQQLVEDISTKILQMFIPTDYQLFTQKNIQSLTQIPSHAPSSISPQLQQYLSYITLKITSIGIQKHQISILKFHRYKQNKDIGILHQLANTGQDSPHIYESRFLLGRYYHHTNISGVLEQVRQRRAFEEYARASKNRLLAELIYLVEGGGFGDGERVVNRFFWYATVIVAVLVFLYWKRNKKMDEILMMQEKKIQEEQRERMKNIEDKRIDVSGIRTESNKDNKDIPSQLKKNDFLFFKGSNQNTRLNQNEKQRQRRQKQTQYKGPKFSEQQEQNMRNRRNLMNIGLMLDQKMKKQEQKAKQKQKINITIDKNQPIITADDEQQQINKLHYQ